MHVRMMRHGGTPGVQHRRDADARAEVLGVGRDRQRGLGRRLHQEVVDHALVLIGDVAQLSGQRVDDMEVADRQQLGLALGEPLPRSGTLALRAVPIAATIKCDDGMSAGAVLAARNVTASCGACGARRAAVRQRSIAVITFIWSRLT